MAYKPIKPTIDTDDIPDTLENTGYSGSGNPVAYPTPNWKIYENKSLDCVYQHPLSSDFMCGYTDKQIMTDSNYCYLPYSNMPPDPQYINYYPYPIATIMAAIGNNKWDLGNYTSLSDTVTINIPTIPGNLKYGKSLIITFLKFFLTRPITDYGTESWVNAIYDIVLTAPNTVSGVKCTLHVDLSYDVSTITFTVKPTLTFTHIDSKSEYSIFKNITTPGVFTMSADNKTMSITQSIVATDQNSILSYAKTVTAAETIPSQPTLNVTFTPDEEGDAKDLSALLTTFFTSQDILTSTNPWLYPFLSWVVNFEASNAPTFMPQSLFSPLFWPAQHDFMTLSPTKKAYVNPNYCIAPIESNGQITTRGQYPISEFMNNIFALSKNPYGDSGSSFSGRTPFTDDITLPAPFPESYQTGSVKNIVSVALNLLDGTVGLGEKMFKSSAGWATTIQIVLTTDPVFAECPLTCVVNMKLERDGDTGRHNYLWFNLGLSCTGNIATPEISLFNYSKKSEFRSTGTAMNFAGYLLEYSFSSILQSEEIDVAEAVMIPGAIKAAVTLSASSGTISFTADEVKTYFEANVKPAHFYPLFSYITNYELT